MTSHATNDGTTDAQFLTIILPDYDHGLQYTIRCEAKTLVIEPQFDYKDEEFHYIFTRRFSKKWLSRQEKRRLPFIPQTNTEFRAIAEQFLEQIASYRPTVFRRQQPSPHWPDEVVEIVLAALRTFGIDALRLCAADARIVRQHDTKSLSYGFLASVDRLREVISEIIRDWQRRVQEESDISKRRQVQDNLRQIGNALIPSTQGKRAQRIRGPDDVKKYYYGALFRCEQADILLRKTVALSGCRRWEVRLRAVCERFGLPGDPQWWGFSEEAQVLRQLLHPKESAILLTAHHFRPAKEQTIRNILSR